mgnify:CR=1 FL=1
MVTKWKMTLLSLVVPAFLFMPKTVIAQSWDCYLSERHNLTMSPLSNENGFQPDEKIWETNSETFNLNEGTRFEINVSGNLATVKVYK